MGATNFESIVRGDGLTMEEAYRQAVEQAHYDYGHDPYNGTISTTSGVVLDPALEGRPPLTFEEAYIHLGIAHPAPEDATAWWDKDEQPQKWESAWAIPLAAEEPKPDRQPWETDASQPGWLFYGWAAC
jgi:hypothetical protein